MQEISTNHNLTHNDVEIDFKEIIYALWEGKWVISSFTTFIAIIALIYSINLPNIYESKALLSPVHSSNNPISNSLQSYSGIAGLAGISLPSGTAISNEILAIEKLKSFSFFEQNILPNIFLPDLMALVSWDYNTNKLNYNEEFYNNLTNTWVRDYAYPQKLIPSSQESFDKYINHFQLSKDYDTGFITLTIKHQSPFIAKEWLELTVNQINQYFRDKDKLEANKAIAYLNTQIAMTNLTEIKQAISLLLQEEMKKLALIEARNNYVFDYIDPPVVMEKKSEPKRSLIFMLGVLLGGILSFLYVLIRYFVIDKRTP